MALTDAAIRAVKPAVKPRKLSDGEGMYLEVAPSGGRWWRLKYTSPIDGKEKRLSLGVYPAVSLREARSRRDAMKLQLRDKMDPSLVRRKEKLARDYAGANTFEAVAREWYQKRSSEWVASHSTRLLRMFERDVFPTLGATPISEVTTPDVLAVARRVEVRSPDTAQRLLRRCGLVFSYAIRTQRCSNDPSAPLRGRGQDRVIRAPERKHFAAVIDDRKRLGSILGMMDGYKGSTIVQTALRLAPILFVRPGELRRMEWSQIDWEKSEWRYPISKTARRGVAEHIVPLSKQALTLLKALKEVTGAGRLAFPSARLGGRPMSENAVLVALRSMEIGKDEMTGHGFRAIARTLLAEDLHFRVDLIEHQLAHKVSDPLGRAYNRTQFLKERHDMMQRWSDYLDILKRESRA